MPGALFPGDFECQDYGGLIGLIVGISFGLACLVGGATFLIGNALSTGQRQRQEELEQQFGAYQEGGQATTSTAGACPPPQMQQPLYPPMLPPPAYPGPPTATPPAWAPGDTRVSTV